MQIRIQHDGAFASALVRLEPGEEFLSESGAMYRASSNVDIDVTTHTRGGGGILKGLKRLLAKEHFFFSRYTILDQRPGEIGLAPTLQGEIRVVETDGSADWICTGGAYLGSTAELAIDTRFQGIRGLLSGESLSFLEIAGQGTFLVSAFGRVGDIDVDGGLVVDTGHVVAFEDTLEYSVTKAGGSWLHSFLGGEGLVLEFRGKGKVLVQSHNPNAVGPRLGPLLPPR